MAGFQIIVDNQVAKTTDNLRDAVVEAATCLKARKEARIEIVSLSGGIYNKDRIMGFIKRSSFLYCNNVS